MKDMIMPASPDIALSDHTKRGSLQLPVGNVITVQDAIDLLSEIQDRNRPLLIDSEKFCSSLSCRETEGCIRMNVYQASGGDWAPPPHQPPQCADAVSDGLAYINPHYGIVMSVPALEK
jgi:hypothetical protein